MNEDEIFEVTVESEVKGSLFLFTQKTNKSKKLLSYDYKRCNGCCLCVTICPKKAIEAGPVIEIATGMDAPPVIIDHTRCSFCGMCAAFCPVKALQMKVNGRDILELEEYPHLDSKVTFNDKCLPCLLCMKACPEDAIEVEFTFLKKESIVPFRPGKEGEIKVDMEKCTLCGVCAELCPAFVLVEKESKPNDLMPFDSLLIDEDKCDYCGICVPLCPEDAITVRGCDEEEVKRLTLEITGNIKVNDKCTHCGWCEEICPYDAVEVTKPFEGEIELIDTKLRGCDPIGCHACFNVCPSKAWVVPPDKKIDVIKDFCIYCGACEKACHVRAIEVKRTRIKHTPIAETPWAQEWKSAIFSLTTEERNLPDISRTLHVEKAERRNESLTKHVINEYQEYVEERISRLSSLLCNKAVRRIWEKNDVTTAVKEIVKRINDARDGI